MQQAQLGSHCIFLIPIKLMCALHLQAVLNLDEVLRDVLAWDMYAVLASEASGGWGRAAQQAPLGFPGIEAYVEAS